MFKPAGYSINADRWEQLHNAKHRDIPIEGTIERVTWADGKPVWILDLGEGITGMVPFNESGLSNEEMMVRFIGQKVFVKVCGFHDETRTVGCSRQDVIADATERFFDEVKEGDRIPAVVKAVLARSGDKPERLQVDIGGGLLVEVPRRYATRSQVLRLAELFPPGTPVQARVIQMDRQSGIIRVSLLDDRDPWEIFEVRRGDFLRAQVVKIVNTEKTKLVLLEVKPGITGIANLPQRGRLQKGDVVPVAVSSFERKNKKLRLRIRGAKLA